MSARILIIEDNPANLELMTYLLQAYGYSVSSASDGGEGVRAAQKGRFDLIICDIQLPVLDGYEIARELKADARVRDTPLLAVTAYAMVDDRKKVLAAGFDGYFSKPITPEIFVEQVHAFLPEEQRAQRATTGAGKAVNARRIDGKRQTILAVDDLEVHLDLASDVFGQSGYKVLRAQGMTAALTTARASLPDLILSDVCMTDGSGYDLLRILRADSRLRDVPVVLLTSTMITQRDRDHGLSLGAAKFLVRPLEPQQLLKEVEGCLRVSPG